MSTVEKNITTVREIIAERALKSGRQASDVRLMAVTKQVDDERILDAVKAGIRIIGENYIQEGKRKYDLIGPRVEWHMIGHLQKNKAKYAVQFVDMIHSVDRFDLAKEIDRRAAAADRTMKILIEVNISGEQSKSGVAAEATLELVRRVSSLPALSIQGLMTMPPWSSDPEDARPYFRSLRLLRDRISEEEIPGVEMRELSMGMTDDYPVAVEEGATIVRIGRAIFGSRA
ncbi:MAG: YggS family pyridoxal phosphate enzyme [delta proteobacterium MLS_D]|jgi:PLP dependent protein|nr:MAG: YggS family pyridoxal phosphate enzyme [delta proteobacterium MLS_D]